MIDRLQLLLNYYNLSASSFADKINVPRSSISHLLSGRNKPSLDFIMKVVNTFDEVEIEWIVYGNGTFPKSKKVIQSNSTTTETKSLDLFSKSVGGRLQLLLNYYNLSASSFADKINVPRSSISHLLSGRNKPSLDFIMKVVNTFDEVEIEWMVYGNGTFPKSKKVVKSNPTIETKSLDLFSKSASQVEKSIPLENNKNEKNTILEESSELKNIENYILDEKLTKSDQSENLTKKVIKVILFYDDGTFENFKEF